MLEISDTMITQWIGQFLWPFFRISAFMMAAPVFGANFVTGRIRLILGFLIAFILAPMLPAMPAVDSLSFEVVLITLQQLIIGVLLGFSVQILFQIFVVSGQIIAMNMGLGFASMVDPSNGISVAVVSQIYLFMITLLFVVTNGHLVMLEVLVNSFTTIPVGESLPVDNIWRLVNWGSWMFTSALLLALPMVTALLIVNITFGIMTRAAPQLNIFALGFPLSLLMGLIAIWMSVSDFIPKYDDLSKTVFMMMRDLSQVN